MTYFRKSINIFSYYVCHSIEEILFYLEWLQWEKVIT